MRWLPIAALAALFLPAIGEARPVDPRGGAYELGVSGFVSIEEDLGDRNTQLGPQLHFAYRGPIAPSLQLGVTGRFGLSGGGGLAAGPTATFSMESRWVFGGFDTMPYLLAGFGVAFSGVQGVTGDRVTRARPLLPVGIGIESRISDTLMLGFSLRYSFILSSLSETIGPADVAVCLVFL